MIQSMWRRYNAVFNHKSGNFFPSLISGCYQADESSATTEEGAYHQWNLGYAREQKPKYCQLCG